MSCEAVNLIIILSYKLIQVFPKTDSNSLKLFEWESKNTDVKHQNVTKNFKVIFFFNIL